MDKKKWIGLWILLSLLGSVRLNAAITRGSDTAKKMLTTYDLKYGRKLNDQQQVQSLKLDVYRQSDDKMKPVVIFIHGGGFGGGDKQQDLYIKMAMAFARRGYIAFVINYRLKSAETPCGPEVLESALSDVSDAIRWIKRNRNRFKADISRMIICGDSAGGALAVNMCFDHAKDRMFSGCIDLWGGMCDPADPGFTHRPPWYKPVYAKPLAESIPPVCLIHGSADQVVPYSTSEQLSAQLTGKGIYNELHPIPGADHYPENKADAFIPIMLAFSDKVISGAIN